MINAQFNDDEANDDDDEYDDKDDDDDNNNNNSVSLEYFVARVRKVLPGLATLLSCLIIRWKFKY